MNMSKLSLKGILAAVKGGRKAVEEKAKAAVEAAKEAARATQFTGLFGLVKSGPEEVLFVGTFTVGRRPIIATAAISGPDAGKSFPLWVQGWDGRAVLESGVETAEERKARKGFPVDLVRGTARGDAAQAAVEEFLDVVKGSRKAASVLNWAEAACEGQEDAAGAIASAFQAEIDDVLTQGGPNVFRAANDGNSEEDFAGFLPEAIDRMLKKLVENMREQRAITRPPERHVRKGEWARRKAGALPESPALPPLQGPALENELAIELSRLVMGGEDEGPAAAALDARAAAWDAQVRAKSAGALLAEKQG